MPFRTIAACVALYASAGNAGELLELASAFDSSVPVIGEQSGRFVEIFNGISKGVEFRYHRPGVLVPVSQSLEAVSAGHVDASFSVSGYWQDRLPAAALFSSFPFGFDALERVAWLHAGNGLKLYQEMYDRAGYDVVVVPCGMIPAETSGWFKKEITSPEDLAGLRMRVFGFGAEVFAKFGVDAGLLLADSLSRALERGELDAVEFSAISADIHLGLHEHTGFAYFPGWHQPSTLFELLMNRAAWNGLDIVSQNAVQAACSANILENLAHAEAKNHGALNLVTAGGDVQIRTWSRESLDAFEKAWTEVVTEHAGNDRFFRKVWTDIEAFRAEREQWNRVSQARQYPAGQ